jgi:hypothetical protein
VTEVSEFPRVDALFSGEPPPPLLDGGPPRRVIRRILCFAIPLDLLAIPLWTGVPGAILTLWAWLRADAEAQRVEEGRYEDADSAALLRLRRVARAALIFILLSFVLQIWLLGQPAYTEFYRGLWAE